MLELVAGVVVALAALAAVLEPLVMGPRRALVAEFPLEEPDLIDPEESDSPKIRALLALKEIEFDRATGKLSDEDYARLKAKYAADAVAAIRTEDESERDDSAAIALDAAEAAVARVKARGTTVCPACGPRPEPGARFCSACGRSLGRGDARPRCSECGAEVPEGAKYCARCGGQVAA